MSSALTRMELLASSIPRGDSGSGLLNLRAGWTIQCDFDGTINLEDVTDTLLQRFGRQGWQELELAWEQGRIGSRACMQGQIALLDMSRDELESELSRMQIDPGFAGFVALAHCLGIEVQVVSDGLDWAIASILERHGLPHLPVMANHLVQEGPRRWALQTPWAAPGCARASANCKCARLSAPRALGRRVLFIGDGSSDFCVSEAADFVLAKDRLIAHCERAAVPHRAFVDFEHAQCLLRDMLGHFEAERAR